MNSTIRIKLIIVWSLLQRFDTFGVFGLGEEYADECDGGSCMSQLSFQILVLMLVKPFPKFFKDIILP